MKKLLSALAASLLLGLLAISACSDTLSDQPCTGIPAGGCPLAHGVACEDPLCERIYACRPGNVWELDHTCPAHDAGPPSDSSVDALPLRDAAIDAPPGANGGPGCESLQTPDCALALALACGTGCCECEDLFVCQNGGWAQWGSCSADAGIVEKR